MDEMGRLKQDVREGRIDPARLIDLIANLQRQLQEARRQIEELEKKVGGSPTVKTEEPYSMRAEEKRQQARGKKPRKKKKPGRCGRLTTAQKIARAERIEKVFPPGVPECDCKLSHTRPLWRFENGRT